MVETIAGMAAIAERYDAFVLDIWGVLYDGGPANPGVTPCLAELKRRGKKVLLLSNSPRRLPVLHGRMERIGIPRHLYDEVHSSGEETYLRLRDGAEPLMAGERYAESGPKRFAGLLDGLPKRRVAIEEADFLLASGPDKATHTIADYRDFNARGLARGLPMLCANPDLEVIDSGIRQICAGTIAADYEAQGGIVRRLGKPHGEVYATVKAMLGVADPSRVLAVGDTLWTDVRGAAAAGFDSLLVMSGIHGDRCRFTGESWDDGALAALLAETGDRPHYAAAWFRW